MEVSLRPEPQETEEKAEEVSILVLMEVSLRQISGEPEAVELYKFQSLF